MEINNLAGLSGGTGAWSQFESIHARNVRQHFRITTPFAGNRSALRLYDLQALATERRDLTAWRAETSGPWAVLGDGGNEALRIAPIDWIDLDTSEREAMSWKDWRKAFHDRYDELVYGIDVTAPGARS